MVDNTNSFQDPLIRPGVNLPLIGTLVLIGLPFVLLLMVLAKEPATKVSETAIFKPGAVQQAQRP